MDTSLPGALTPAQAAPAAGPKCRLCHSGYRRRSPGQKYCERCRLRRSSPKARKPSVQSGSSQEPLGSSISTHSVLKPMFAILTLGEDRVPITIPVNARIEVLGGQQQTGNSGLVQVVWSNRSLLVFAEDLERRAGKALGWTEQ